MKDFKKDFPLLENNPGLHYLDNAATTQKPGIVIEAIKRFYEEKNANTHRSIYSLSEQATNMLEDAREKIALLINTNPEEIIFTKNATEGLNNLANSLSAEVKENNNIVVTELEHHSNFVPWQQLAKKKKCEFRVAKYEDVLKDSAEAIKKLVDSNTSIVSFTHMSNVTGKILNVKKIVGMVRKKNKNTIIVVDSCQAAAHLKINAEELGADFICMSAHKFYGPMGIGVLYGRKELLKNINPFLYGGNMISKVTIEKSEWAEPPGKFEAGTIDVAGIIGAAKALEYFHGNYEEIKKDEEALKEKLLGKLREIKGVKVIGHEDKGYGPIVSFTVNRIHPHDLATIADRNNVCIRAGHHCAQPFMAALGVSATSRASLACYNKEEDVDKLIESINQAKKMLG